MKEQKKGKKLAAKPDVGLPAKAEEAKRPGALPVRVKPGESLDRSTSRVLLDPATGPAILANAYRPFGLDPIPLGDMIEELETSCAMARSGDLGRCESMLAAQAHALDSIFCRLAIKASENIGNHLGAAESYLRLALKAQSQCRTTLETLANIKQGPPVFAKNANVAHNQQVNIGASPVNSGGGTRGEEISESENKLLEAL
jgi:hypothetical protein